MNNSLTVAWKATNPSADDGYVLELDDGSGGEFRVSLRDNFFFQNFNTYNNRYYTLKTRKYTVEKKAFVLWMDYTLTQCTTQE